MSQVERQKTRLNQREEQRLEAEDFAWLMSDKAGRRIVWRLLAEAGVYRTSYSDNATDTAFREGRRALGLSVLDRAMVSVEAFISMLKENSDVS